MSAVARLIDVAALLGQPAGDVGVRVPIVVIDLHEAHAALDHPPGQQGRVGERAGLLRRVAVELVGRFGLAGDVGQLRHAGLHAIRQLVLLNARVRLRIAELLVVQLVERADAVEARAADIARHAGRIVDVQDRIAGRAEAHARVLAGQKPARPEPRRNRLHLLGVRAAGDHHHERRQVVVERAQAVRAPRAEARPARHLVAGLHERDRRLVVDRLGVHAADEHEVVGHLLHPRQQLADPHARLAAPLELVHRRRDREAGLAAGHRREPLAHADRFGQVLVEPFLHDGLVIEQIHLRRAADHVQVDDVLGLRGEVRERAALAGFGPARQAVPGQRRQRRGAQQIASRPPENAGG